MSSEGTPSTEAARRAVSRDPDGWARMSGLTLAEAEQLLDWLEGQGVHQREVLADGVWVAVRWKE